MRRTSPSRLFVTLLLAGPMVALPASISAQSGAQTAGRVNATLAVSSASAKDINALLDKNQFSRETAGLLVRMVLSHDGAAFAGRRHSSGGWCWNEDGSFYGSTPCPKEIVNRDRAGAAGVKAAPRRATQPLVLREGQVSREVSSDIDALLGTTNFSKETAGLLVQIAGNGNGGKFPGYRKGGGWCWNDDGTFHGSLPCPKK